VGRVDADLQVLRGPVEHFREVFELAAELGAAAGVGLDEDGDAVGDVEFVQRAGGVVEAALDAGAGVGARWTLTYSTSSLSAASTSFCIESMDFSRRSSFGVQRLTRYEEWMTHGPTSFSSVRSRNRSASSSSMFGSCQTCGEWLNICPQFPPYSTCSSTALYAPPAMEVCAPTLIPWGSRPGL